MQVHAGYDVSRFFMSWIIYVWMDLIRMYIIILYVCAFIYIYIYIYIYIICIPHMHAQMIAYENQLFSSCIYAC
jgi:hypothetical protein